MDSREFTVEKLTNSRKESHAWTVHTRKRNSGKYAGQEDEMKVFFSHRGKNRQIAITPAVADALKDPDYVQLVNSKTDEKFVGLRSSLKGSRNTFKLSRPASGFMRYVTCKDWVEQNIPEFPYTIYFNVTVTDDGEIAFWNTEDPHEY